MGSGQKENTLEFCLDVKRPLPVNLVRGKRFAHPVISSTEDLAMSLLIPYVKGHIGKIILGFVLLCLNSVLAVLPALVSQMLFDNGFLNQSLLWIIACCFLLVMFALAQSALSVATVKVFSQIGETVVSDMRVDMTNAALVMPSTRTASLGTGYILSRIDEVGRIGSLFSSSFSARGLYREAFTTAFIPKSIKEIKLKNCVIEATKPLTSEP